MNRDDDKSPSEVGREMLSDLKRSLATSTIPPRDGSIDRPLLISSHDTDADIADRIRSVLNGKPGQIVHVVEWRCYQDELGYSR